MPHFRRKARDSEPKKGYTWRMEHSTHTKHSGRAGGAGALLRQAVRYGAAAFGGFLADYLTLFALTKCLPLHYLAAVPVAFLVGTFVNYRIGRRLAFSKSTLDKRVELSGFLAISLFSLLLTEGCMALFSAACGVHYLLSRVLTGAVTFAFNFLSRRFLLYRGAPPVGGDAGEVEGRRECKEKKDAGA